MTVFSSLTADQSYGVHECTDRNGNHGTDILSQREIKISTTGAHGLFEKNHEQRFVDAFSPNGTAERKLMVVIDDQLPGSRRDQIEAYFEWCKEEELIQDFSLQTLPMAETEKTVEKVSNLIKDAFQVGLKRRDLFVAIGRSVMTDIVGFTAAIYRRSTPWILIPQDLTGILRSPSYDTRLHANYNHGGTTHKGTFALTHPPVASFYDPGGFHSLHKDDLRSGLAEMIRISLHQDSTLFSFLEARIESILEHPEDTTSLETAVDLAIRAVLTELDHVDASLPSTSFSDLAINAIGDIREISADEGHSTSLGLAIASAFSFLKGYLSSADLERTLSLLQSAGLPIFNETLEGSDLWQHMIGSVHGGASCTVTVPLIVGQCGHVNVMELSQRDITDALSLLSRHGSGIQISCPESSLTEATIEVSKVVDNPGESYHQTLSSEDTRYQVITVPGLFNTTNTTLIQDYCVEKHYERKKKILIVVDGFVGPARIADIDEYFKRYKSAIDDFCIVPLHVSSHDKDLDSTLKVVNAAMELDIGQRDLMIVVGGGTLMDIVGFAAAMFKGGIPYVRVPTTLIGMIDAGVGIKTGVNVEGHKSAIGRYFAPVACLNDPETFLLSLPRREFASGLAEAIKMALLKSPRLFEIIERYHRNADYNTYTHELIHISIHTMLEELQPNLYEHDLRRSVDFGHEFGHIVEALAQHEIPHGECVAVGMSISSFLAHRKGILSRADLERILNCILDLGLPIYARDYDCCASNVLWSKIKTEGIEHKDGMLWLAIPEKIGQGGFLDNISDINAGMVNEVLLRLKEYADGYNQQSTLRTKAGADDFRLTNGEVSTPKPEVPKSLGSCEELDLKQSQATTTDSPNSLSSREGPSVIVVDVGATYLRFGIMGPQGDLLIQPVRIPSPSKQLHPEATLATLQEKLLQTLAKETTSIRANHSHLSLSEVGISFGAVITRDGIVKDASILWNEPAAGFDFKAAAEKYLPGFQLTILNDISAAAWRYKDEDRFCLITVSSGLSNKVFNFGLEGAEKLDLDDAGVGGEMGHVVVEPRAVDTLVQYSIHQAGVHCEDFQNTMLSKLVGGDASKITARHLAQAFKEGDEFSARMLEEADVPCCPCGNLADLCSYSSGRGALRQAKILAARGDYGVVDEITDAWLQQGIQNAHPLAIKVLHDSTYPLALRILQLAADIGLDKFIIVGGFALKTGGSEYIKSLQDHIVRFCHHSAFFSDWSEEKLRGLVRLGCDDDNDGIVGMGNYVQHSQAQYRAVVKAVGEKSLKVETRPIPRCGSLEVLAKVVYSGICSTDVQILRGDRGLEPVVLGHEGVCQVVEVGKDVKGLEAGEVIIVNPNNPLDDHDKVGHNREGMFQEYFKFGDEFLQRGQILKLGHNTPSPTDTLIEPLGGVVAALDRLQDRVAGKNILVLGAGPVGLMFVMMAQKTAARNVFLANRSQERLDFAVARGITTEEKSFVFDPKTLASQIDQVSSGEGVDVIIVCVSLGQGQSATQEALHHVNPGGSLYLFAGFRSGDTLALDQGEKVDIWPIRVGWKTKSIQHSGKSVDLIGQRGSRKEDLARAVDIMRQNNLSFGKIISHIISVDALPDVMQCLVQDRKLNGVPANRVVMDMEARQSVIEFTEELPLRQLYEAAFKPKDTIPVGNIFRDIGFDGDNSVLGWVQPPLWSDIESTIKSALNMKSLSGKKHFIWVGTGPWAFMIDALQDIMPSSSEVTFHTLQSLDPKALEGLLTSVGDLSTAVCLGMSQSGKTLETVQLMNTLRAQFDTAGLNYRQHFMWFTDISNSHESGETAIRNMNSNVWQDVDMLPLTFGNHSNINALFCAPHSLPFIMALTLLLQGDLNEMRRMYQQYLATRDQSAHDILPKAYSIATNHINDIRIGLEDNIAPSMTNLVTQLIEQGLGSKQSGFNPRVQITSCSKVDAAKSINLSVSAEMPTPVKMMLAMSTLSTFVASVAYHRRIPFVTHPKVDLYKHQAQKIMAEGEVKQKTSSREEMGAGVLDYLKNNPQTRFVEVLCYEQVNSAQRESVKNLLVSDLSPTIEGVSVEVFQGEMWNHSRYQAAVQREDTLYVVLVLETYWCRILECGQVEGIPEGITRANIRMLKAIAHATHQTLSPRALCFQV